MGAVLAFPAGVADFPPGVPTSEVAKGVISWPAEHRAALPVVVLITHESVGVLEVCTPTAVQVLGPLLAHRQVPLCGQATDESFWVLCGKRMLPWIPNRPRSWGGGKGKCMCKARRPESLYPELLEWQAGWRMQECPGALRSSFRLEGLQFVLPVARSSGESVCRASMIREKVPWRRGGGISTDPGMFESAEHPGQASQQGLAGRACMQRVLGRAPGHLLHVFTFLKEMEELYKEWFPGMFFQPVSTGYV